MNGYKIEREYGKMVVGIDEAGRGPLAGNVYAAACWINQDLFPRKVLKKLKDSKLIVEPAREALYEELLNLEKGSFSYSLGTASVEEIDQLNILNASMLAMGRAYNGLAAFNDLYDCVIVDGNKTPSLNCRCEYIIGGDNKAASIALASIIAKVERDRYMRKIHNEFPVYGWERNKGYGTKAHRMALKEFGSSQYHRKSFRF
jgi:ribonuclease HII